METRSAAAFLGIHIAELRRMNKAGIIMGESSILGHLYSKECQPPKTNNDMFEQVELENYLESH